MSLTAPKTHFLDIADLEGDDLRHLLDAAHARKSARAGKPKGALDDDAPLAGYALAMIFEKPSTRTRLSFNMGMRQLGGETVILNHTDMQLGRGESIADTAQVLSRFADIIMLRTGPHNTLTELAVDAQIPVINGLTAYSHPCQIVADLMTFEEHKGRFAGQRLAWLGDGNNVAMSFVHAAALLDFELALASPEAFSISAAEIDKARAKGAKITLCETAQEAADGAASLITDCWVSMSDDPAETQSRVEALAPYQVTQDLMARGDDPIFMHCLPAHRDSEVTTEVIDGPRSVVFDEAENRAHAQKAILLHCLGLDKTA